MRVVALGMFLLVLGGCQMQPTDSLVTQCTTPRPQLCTTEYAPVCALVSQGGQKQYPSACNACADDTVAGYAWGECAQ